MDYVIKEVSYTREEFKSLFNGRTLSAEITKDKYTLKGKTVKGYVSPCETFRLAVFTDNPQLYELSRLDDVIADEFINNLAKEIETLLSSIARKEEEDSRRETRKKALELIEQLK